jgi:serine/threonine protein kinase
MASVHIGSLTGPAGFRRTVAVKRLHPQYAKDPEFVAMFMDEARLAARIQHQNVVATLDVVASDEELYVVMEYVAGESLARLMRLSACREERVTANVAGAILVGVLHGLHAAHELRDDRGEPLAIVHRDVSPQNILVGADGAAHLIDFGIAKARGRAQVTQEGEIKGKMSYMPPEQLLSREVDRRVDIFAASVVFWEVLTGRRLFQATDPGAILCALAVPLAIAGSAQIMSTRAKREAPPERAAKPVVSSPLASDPAPPSPQSRPAEPPTKEPAPVLVRPKPTSPARPIPPPLVAPLSPSGEKVHKAIDKSEVL